LVFLAPSALAQAPVPWGVYVCQLYSAAAENDPSGINQQGQYPLTNFGNCSATPIETTMLTNSVMVGPLKGSGGSQVNGGGYSESFFIF
jgi:hypothetical protein